MNKRIDYNFWTSWKNKTKQEIKYIVALKRARLFILKNLPKKKIHSIYVKGSFVRRELTPKSDIDIAIITKDNKTLKKVLVLRKENNEKLSPAEIVTPYSLTEFRKNKPSSKNGKGFKVAVFLFHIEHHRLIYGKPINKNGYWIPTAKGRLNGLIQFLEKEYIPSFYKGESFGFRYLAKQVFWLADLELRIKDKLNPKSFKEITKKYPDKKHIIHDAMRIRKLGNTKNPTLRKEFLKKLETYISELKKLI